MSILAKLADGALEVVAPRTTAAATTCNGPYCYWQYTPVWPCRKRCVCNIPGGGTWYGPWEPC